MKRQKMITLCPTTYEIAKAMPNFSQWVRNQLRTSKNLETEAINTFMSRDYMCDVCGTQLHTHNNLHGVPHAVNALGKYSDVECSGTFWSVM